MPEPERRLTVVRPSRRAILAGYLIRTSRKTRRKWAWPVLIFLVPVTLLIGQAVLVRPDAPMAALRPTLVIMAVSSLVVAVGFLAAWVWRR